MDKSDISKFLKEQRRKTDEDNYKDTDRRRVSSYRSRDEPYEEPSNTIMIRGLPSDITEDDIKVSLDDMHADYIAVRLIKDRRSGTNKGVAFIEFIAVNDAKEFMYDTRAELNICGYYGKLSYGYNVKEEVDRYDAEKINAWKYETPTNTIMLRGVSNILSDNEVRAYVSDVSKHVVDVRLIRDKKTGMSRGFGFVEFDSVVEAQSWMEYQQGYFMIDDVEMKLSYTSTRQGGTAITEYFATDAGDWSCARCGGHNFKRRDFCYKCHLSKSQSKSVMETIDGKDQIGTTPCNSLILRDLDALTQEDAIIKALKLQFKVNVTKCKIMRDDVTKVSRCFAFVELCSLSESQKVVEYYEDNPDKVFELCGKVVTINYAKNNFNTLIASYKEALSKRFEETYEPPVHETSNYDANAAAAVTQAALNNKNLHKKGAGRGAPMTSTVLPSNVIVEGRTTESTEMCFELIVNGQRCTSVPTNPFTMTDIDTATYTKPDITKFLYDQSTQYYFDPISGLYYDTNSQYFFDRLSQQYLYWNQTRNTYVPVETATKSTQLTADKNKPIQKEGKKSKTNEAKKIAKEMERWEKMMNSKKDSTQSNNVKKDNMSANTNQVKEAAADTGFAMLTDTRPIYCPVAYEDRAGHRAATDDLVAAYNSDSDNSNSNSSVTNIIATMDTKEPLSSVTGTSNQLIEEEEKLINWDKVACLLCNRGFKDRVTLEKHRSVSDLHKKNMEYLKEKLGVCSTTKPTRTKQGKIKYRDRAKERREKFGVPSPINKRRYEIEEEEWSELACGEGPAMTSSTSVVSVAGEDGDTIGSRLMAKMGWQQGQGLGKLNQGRTEAVQAEFVARGAGIGAAPKFQGTPSDNYRENLKRAMYAKYHDG